MKVIIAALILAVSGTAFAGNVAVETKTAEHGKETKLSTSHKQEDFKLDTSAYTRALERDRYYGLGATGTYTIEKMNEISLGASVNVLNEEDRQTSYSLGLCRWVTEENQLCLNSSYTTEKKPEAEVLNSDFDLVKIPADSNIVSNELTHRVLINPTMTALYGFRYQKSARGELVGSRAQVGKFFSSTRSAILLAANYADELRLVEPALTPAMKAFKAKITLGQEVGPFLLRVSYRAYILEDAVSIYGSDTGELGVDYLGDGYAVGAGYSLQKDNEGNQSHITTLALRKEFQ